MVCSLFELHMVPDHRSDFLVSGSSSMLLLWVVEPVSKNPGWIAAQGGRLSGCLFCRGTFSCFGITAPGVGWCGDTCSRTIRICVAFGLGAGRAMLGSHTRFPSSRYAGCCCMLQLFAWASSWFWCVVRMLFCGVACRSTCCQYVWHFVALRGMV